MPQPISAEKRSQLLIQIFSLFVRQGFEEITMDEIASEIRISKLPYLNTSEARTIWSRL